MTPFRRARLRLLRAEAARRAPKASSVAFDPRAHARPAQVPFVRDPARFRVLCCSRRAGKTTTAGDDILAESWANPNGTVVYLNTTRERAQRNLWDEIKEAVRREGMPYTANEAKLSLRGPDRRWIYLSGGESRKHIDRWKGTLPRIVAFYVDEAQDWDEELLEYAIARVILPALADIAGRLAVMGTPGPLPEGFFYNLTQDPEWSRHGWTMFDIHDPAAGVMVGAHELLAETMRIRGVTIDDPTIQREFFGRWVRDTAALVFGALDDELNAYDVLPEGDYLHIGGVDGGYVDSAALSRQSWAEKVGPEMYLTALEAFSHTGAIETVQKCVDFFNPLGARLMGIAADPAAGMKNIAHDVWVRHGLHMEPAEKADKVGGVKLLASAIASRLWKAPRGHKIFKLLRRVQWDPDHRGEKLLGHTPDEVDSILYGFRKAYPMWFHTPPPPPKTYEEQRLARILAAQEAGGDI